jgi:hypothetical protein
MKNLLCTLCLILAGTCANLYAQDAVLAVNKIEASEKSMIEWEQTTSDLGVLTQNVPATAIFTLTNRSDQPLLLKEVKPSCGCTIASYPQEPISPGETAKIKTTYNAKKVGNFQKTIKVHTNLNDTVIPLTLKGTVIAE